MESKDERSRGSEPAAIMARQLVQYYFALKHGIRGLENSLLY